MALRKRRIRVKKTSTYLPSIGDMSAKVMLIIDPVVGNTSAKVPLRKDTLQWFAEHLSSIGLKREDCFIVSCAPPVDSDTWEQGRLVTAHLKEHRDELLKTIKSSGAKIILPFGAKACQQVIGRAVQITKVRGQAFNDPDVANGRPVLPMLSPFYAQRQPENEAAFVADLQTARRIIDGGFNIDASAIDYKRNYKWCWSTTALRKYLKGAKRISVDVESVGLQGFNPDTVLLTVQIAKAPGSAVIVPIDYDRGKYRHHNFIPWDTINRKGLISVLKDTLEDPSVEVVGQNFKFDWLMLWYMLGIETQNYADDSQLLAHLLDENQRKMNIDDLVRRYVPEMSGFNDPYNHDPEHHEKTRMDLLSPEKMLQYGCGDPDAALRLCDVLKAEVKQDIERNPARNLWKTYQHVTMPAQRAFCYIEQNGFPVSKEMLVAFEKKLRLHQKKERGYLMRQIPKAIRDKWRDSGVGLKPTRAAILKDWLYEHKKGLRLKPVLYTKTKEPSISSKNALPYYVADYPVIQRLIDYIKNDKMLNTYAKGFHKYIFDGLIRPSYGLAGTVTGRSMSRDPNGQNFPKRGKMAKEYRKIFQAPPGWVFISCFAEGSMVQMGDGSLVSIEAITDGEVITHTGATKAVVNYRKSYRDTIKVVAADNSEFEVTPDHNMYIVRDGKFEWVEAQQLKDTDYLVTPERDLIYGNWSNDDAYWAAFFNGDGSYLRKSWRTKNGKTHRLTGVSMSFGNDLNHLCNVFGQYSGVPPHPSKARNGDVAYHSVELAARMQKLSGKGSGADIRIPKWVMAGDDDTRLSYLAGAVDSDGSYHSRRFTYSSISRQYVHDLHLLCKSLGIYGKISYVETTSSWRLDVFATCSLARMPITRLNRKNTRLAEFRNKKFTQCSTEFVPASLLDQAKQPGMQNTPAANRLFSNSRRTGHATRDAVLLAADDNINCVPLLDLLKYRYTAVAAVKSGRKQVAVYDLEVEGDHSFVVQGFAAHNCDLSQAELRIAAMMSGDPNMLAVYAHGGDIHRTTAAGTMGISVEEFLKLPPDVQGMKRFQAKAVNFGFLYGMWWKKFRSYAKTDYGIDFTEEEAQTIRENFFKTYPMLSYWHDDVQEHIQQTGYIRTFDGRIRHLPNVFSPDEGTAKQAMRQAINSPVQSIASDLGLMTLGRLIPHIRKHGFEEWIKPCGFIHDAIVCLVREDKVAHGCDMVKRFMENNPLEEWFDWTPEIPILADAEVGRSLADTYELSPDQFVGKKNRHKSYTDLKTEERDSLLKKAANERDEDKRAKLMIEVEAIEADIALSAEIPSRPKIKRDILPIKRSKPNAKTKATHGHQESRRRVRHPQARRTRGGQRSQSTKNRAEKRG